ncbi:MAG: hypothetical protein HQK53_01395 [Oligoflexia bacterium]|nr:hypothetical protein [Oligoflexia bacterium]
MDFYSILRDVAKFAGKTCREVEEAYLQAVGKDKPKKQREEKSLKQRILDDLAIVYRELGENTFSYLQNNNAFGDEKLKKFVIRIEKLKKNMQDLADIETEIEQERAKKAEAKTEVKPESEVNAESQTPQQGTSPQPPQEAQSAGASTDVPSEGSPEVKNENKTE